MTKIIDELHVNEFNVMRNIITDQEIIMWESMGLTTDAQSLENAALLSQVLKTTHIYRVHSMIPLLF